jgi:hypothetical protein
MPYPSSLGCPCSNAPIAVTKGKYGTHMWDLNLIHVMGDPFIIVSRLALLLHC